MSRIYLDSVSGTPVLPEVLELMSEYLTESFGNPASLHGDGVRARAALERAREQTAKLLGASDPSQVLFTSDAAESANLAIKGLALSPRRRGDHIVTTSFEHPSIRRSTASLRKLGIAVTEVGCDHEGRVSPEAIEAALTEQTFLIALHLVNHDLGVIQSIEKTGAIAQERGIPLFVDAEAAAGWIPVDIGRLGASLLSCSPHRYYGPKGVGVLFKDRRVRLSPQIEGGDQEFGLRAGTENVAGIAGAGLAAEFALRDLPRRSLAVARIQTLFLDALRQEIQGVRLHGPEPGSSRSPQSLFFSFDGVEGEALVLYCDLQGVALHAGSACSTRSAKRVATLEAIGVPAIFSRGAVLCSFGIATRDEEVEKAIRILKSGVARLREWSPSSLVSEPSTPTRCRVED